MVRSVAFDFSSGPPRTVIQVFELRGGRFELVRSVEAPAAPMSADELLICGASVMKAINVGSGRNNV